MGIRPKFAHNNSDTSSRMMTYPVSVTCYVRQVSYTELELYARRRPGMFLSTLSSSLDQPQVSVLSESERVLTETPPRLERLWTSLVPKAHTHLRSYALFRKGRASPLLYINSSTLRPELPSPPSPSHVQLHVNQLCEGDDDLAATGRRPRPG